MFLLQTILLALSACFLLQKCNCDGECGTFGYQYLEATHSSGSNKLSWSKAKDICSGIIENGVIASIDTLNEDNDLLYSAYFASENNKDTFIAYDDECGYVNKQNGFWYSLDDSDCDIATNELFAVLCITTTDACDAYDEDEDDHEDGAYMIHDYQYYDENDVDSRLYPDVRFKGTERHLGGHWVPNDVRRNPWTRENLTGLTYAVDSTDPPMNTTNETLSSYMSEIERAFDDWLAVGCMTNYDFEGEISQVGIGRDDVQVSPPFTGVFEQVADITVEGFVDRGLGRRILGQARFWLFTNDDDSEIAGNNGPYTDIDNNGLVDFSFCHIRMQGKYWFVRWSTDETSRFDIYTVMAHEIGHCLGVGHFGLIRYFYDIDPDDPEASIVKYIQAPPAIMQPLYDGKDANLHGSDIGAVCSLWGNWA